MEISYDKDANKLIIMGDDENEVEGKIVEELYNDIMNELCKFRIKVNTQK